MRRPKISGFVGYHRIRYLSSEVGTVDDYTVVVTYNAEVKATNYATGVTIKKNTVAQTIDSATRQTATPNVVYFVLHDPVIDTDDVTFEYDGYTGNYHHMKHTTAQTVTNNASAGGTPGVAMGVLCLTYAS